MKKIILFVFLISFSTQIFSQKITSEQEKAIFEIAQKSADSLSNRILTKVIEQRIRNVQINILIEPAKNTNNQITDFGMFYSSFLESSLQSKLNSAIIKRHFYTVRQSNKNPNNNKPTFNLEFVYYFDKNQISITKADLKFENQKFSLKPFYVKGNTEVLVDFNSISANANYDKIMQIKEDNGLFNNIEFSTSDGSTITPKNNVLSLSNNINYKLRLDLQTKNYLYVFYYEQIKGDFSIIYPQKTQDNKKLTYHIKDIRNLRFTDVEEANLMIVISTELLKINDVIGKNNNQVSSDDAEDILDELEKKSGKITSKQYKLIF